MSSKTSGAEDAGQNWTRIAVAAAIAERGLYLADVAEAAGISPDSLGDLLNKGKTLKRPESLARLLNFLGIGWESAPELKAVMALPPLSLWLFDNLVDSDMDRAELVRRVGEVAADTGRPVRFGVNLLGKVLQGTRLLEGQQNLVTVLTALFGTDAPADRKWREVFDQVDLATAFHLVQARAHFAVLGRPDSGVAGLAGAALHERDSKNRKAEAEAAGGELTARRRARYETVDEALRRVRDGRVISMHYFGVRMRDRAELASVLLGLSNPDVRVVEELAKLFETGASAVEGADAAPAKAALRTRPRGVPGKRKSDA